MPTPPCLRGDQSVRSGPIRGVSAAPRPRYPHGVAWGIGDHDFEEEWEVRLVRGNLPNDVRSHYYVTDWAMRFFNRGGDGTGSNMCYMGIWNGMNEPRGLDLRPKSKVCVRVEGIPDGWSQIHLYTHWLRAGNIVGFHVPTKTATPQGGYERYEGVAYVQ